MPAQIWFWIIFALCVVGFALSSWPERTRWQTWAWVLMMVLIGLLGYVVFGRIVQ